MFARPRNARGSRLPGELFLLVVGINVAFWFEDKFDDLRDRHFETA